LKFYLDILIVWIKPSYKLYKTIMVLIWKKVVEIVTGYIWFRTSNYLINLIIYTYKFQIRIWINELYNKCIYLLTNKKNKKKTIQLPSCCI